MTFSSALIDIGGSSVKVTIKVGDSNLITTHEVSLTPTISGKHVFLDPKMLYKAIITAMNNCSKLLYSGIKINKIYISTLRQGFCLVSSSTETTPIYLNSDTSGEFARGDIEKYGFEKIYEQTGHWFAPQLTLPKLINLLHQRIEIGGKGSKLLYVHDWLVWKLGNFKVTEMTLVSAGQMANLTDWNINQEILDYFDIPPELMPDVIPFGQELGDLNSEAKVDLSEHWHEAKLYVGGGDSHFLHMGASGNEREVVVISAGSSTPISLLSKDLGSSTHLKPWKSTSFDRSMYLLEGNVGYPGTHFSWLKNNFHLGNNRDQITIERMLRAPVVFGSCNVWNEEKWKARPPFSILGDFSNSKGEDLLLGLTLDYAFSLANQIQELTKDNYSIKEVVITGGGANLQLQSLLTSLLGIPVNRMLTTNSIDNLFSMLDGSKSKSIIYETEIEVFDRETSEFLQHRAREHKVMYGEVEGTRKVLENVK